MYLMYKEINTFAISIIYVCVNLHIILTCGINIRLSEKFLSFYKEIIDAQCFLFYISLLNYVRT